jgi:phosphate transport system permease protein
MNPLQAVAHRRVRRRDAGPASRPARPLAAGQDAAFRWFTVACAATVVALMGALASVFALEAWPSIKEFGLSFLWSTEWDTQNDRYGGAVQLWGTAASTVIAIVIAVPIALLVALLLVELVRPAVGKVVGMAIEMLAAIPSIIYGMWGLFVLVPLMQRYVQPAIQATPLGKLPLFVGPPYGIGVLTAGLILSLMILPFVTAVSRDVLRMVPQVVKEAGFGMGATTWEVTRKVSLRYGLGGIVGAFFLGLGRAVGETMAVAYVIGGSHLFSWSITDPGYTIASNIANEFPEAAGDLHRASLVELGLILFAATILFQLIAQLWLRRVRKRVGGRA